MLAHKKTKKQTNKQNKQKQRSVVACFSFDRRRLSSGPEPVLFLEGIMLMKVVFSRV